jgi:hypothetical protein
VSFTYEEDVNRWIPAIQETVQHQTAFGEYYSPLSALSSRESSATEILTRYTHKRQRYDLKFLGRFGSCRKSSNRLNLDSQRVRVAHNQREADLPLWREKLTSNSTATVVSNEQNRMMPIVSILVRPYQTVSTCPWQLFVSEHLRQGICIR